MKVVIMDLYYEITKLFRNESAHFHGQIFLPDSPEQK